MSSKVFSAKYLRLFFKPISLVGPLLPEKICYIKLTSFPIVVFFQGTTVRLAQLLPLGGSFSGRAPHTKCRERFSSAFLSSLSFLQQAVLLSTKQAGSFHFSHTVRETDARAITAKLPTLWSSKGLYVP